jgi:hypothetical protein
MHKLQCVVCITITVFTLFGLMLLYPAPARAADTVVTVSAPSSVDPGQTFVVSISVNPGTPIAGVQCNLNFDGGLVTADSVQEGNLLTQGGATFFNPGVISGSSVSGIAGAIITPGGTASSSGTFATITFTAGTEAGTSPLNLSGVVVGDINGDSVPVSTVNDSVSITGSFSNSAPVLSPIGDKQIAEGQNLTFTITATDADDDDLEYSASNLPSGASFNPATRNFSWTPDTGQAGTYYNVRFEVTDGDLADYETITITVASYSSATLPELSTFNVIPLYDEERQLNYVKINYRINDIDPMIDDVKIEVTVMLDGNLFDEVEVIPSVELPSNRIEDVIYYQPAQGWQDGIYSFIAELYAGDQLCETSVVEGIRSSIDATMSWGLLAGLICGALAISAIIIAIILIRYRRQSRMSRLFRAYIKEILSEKGRT